MGPKNEHHISLEKLAKIAERVGGQNNNFNYIQVPCNLAMTEIFTTSNQRMEDKKTKEIKKTLLVDVADAY